MNHRKFVPAIIAAAILLCSVFCSSAAVGDLDLSFDAGSGVNGAINDLVVQPDGKVIVVGNFTTVKDLMRVGIARLNNDGSGDETFNPPLAALAWTAALQADGKTLIGSAGIFRLNLDGTSDTTFTTTMSYIDPTFGPAVSAIAVQPDGKILIGGIFDDVNGASRQGVARLNANGSVDNTFAPPVNLTFASKLQLQTTEKFSSRRSCGPGPITLIRWFDLIRTAVSTTAFNRRPAPFGRSPFSLTEKLSSAGRPGLMKRINSGFCD